MTKRINLLTSHKATIIQSLKGNNRFFDVFRNDPYHDVTHTIKRLSINAKGDVFLYNTCIKRKNINTSTTLRTSLKHDFVESVIVLQFETRDFKYIVTLKDIHDHSVLDATNCYLSLISTSYNE